MKRKFFLGIIVGLFSLAFNYTSINAIEGTTNSTAESISTDEKSESSTQVESSSLEENDSTEPSSTDSVIEESTDESHSESLTEEQGNELSGDSSINSDLFIDESDKSSIPSVTYSVKGNNQGWTTGSDRETVGLIQGESILTAFKSSILNIDDGNIKYRGHFSHTGWGNYVTNGAEISSSQAGSAMQAIQISLTGKISENYDVYYRVYVESLGWLDWAANGKVAGTTNFSLGIKALELCLVAKGKDTPGATAQSAIEFNNTQLSYQAHVRTIGWQNFVADGKTSGTVGKSLRMEALKLSLKNNQATGTIQYRAHVEKIGWQSYSSLGEMTGTTGRGLQMEAVQVKLTGQLAQLYDIYYRVQVKGFGWLGWAKNGEEAGTSNFKNQMEAIEVKLVRKKQGTINTTGRKFINNTLPTISYQAHVQHIGWQNSVSNGATSGTAGKAYRIEAIKANLTNTQLTGTIQYRSYVQKNGWQSYVNANSISGTTGKSLRVEAIQIKLTGELAKYYDVYYRVHSQTFGWLGWAKNGASAGTSEYGYRAEAYQVLLVKKGSAAPGSMGNAYKVKPAGYNYNPTPSLNAWKTATGGVQPNLAGRKNLRVEVSLAKQRVYVYDSTGLIYAMLCSAGTSSTPTVKGNFTIQSRGPQFMGSLGGANYYVQFYGNYLFHSVIINSRGEYIVSEAQLLGTPRSHGCIRLAVPDAIWFYKQIPAGTPVKVY